ncbi:translin-associated protein X-like [Ruditapes philippinarum]|uniref:translin-associated protein X-like n=1 Tax=Ruditapes philippinarum TaxID=129788 RepID=UPI00295B0CD0|nr:translin-associated protein X-like [Ruditapes philippinarum]
MNESAICTFSTTLPLNINVSGVQSTSVAKMADRRKRHRNAKGDKPDRGEEEVQDVDESSPVIQMFRGFQQELDQRHDKHERIVKLSRDITIESKRAIFLLHRVNNPTENADILQQTEEKLAALENTKFREVAKELVNTDPFQFLRAYTAGLQEYIEALTFYVFLKDNKLMPLSDVQARLTFTANEASKVNEDNKSSNENKGVPMELSESENSGQIVKPESKLMVYVPASEYILGLADLTGEMMRRAINSVGCGDMDRPFEICSFLQSIEAAYASLGNANREVNRKLHTLRQSLRKVEMACYTLRVRGSEVPKHMLIDMISKPSMAQLHVDDTEVLDDD